ncbi:unnamed protein product [Caenorhabditis angaria]|uniref:Uncharacterized protein n=1 Tax=Caenorhabditis angaria TaxID=860376 RepID=A0A9P1IG40_9PELO|nr:unnamed protein product [Caenorhabditis angaria]
MANPYEGFSDSEYFRAKKCDDELNRQVSIAANNNKILWEELTQLDPLVIKKLFQRQKNGSMKFRDRLPEKYGEIWMADQLVDLDVMYEQLLEFIENVMETSNKGLIEVDGAQLNSSESDDQNNSGLVLRQPENDREMNDAPQSGDKNIEEVDISSDNETMRTGESEESSSTSSQSRFGFDWEKWFPRVTLRTFLSHYLPASGAVSHTLYTIHLFSPNIISRRHFHCINPWERVEFSVLSSTLFNCVSLPAAILFKTIFPTQTWLKTMFATSLSFYLLSRAYRYLWFLDAESSRSSVSPVL